MKNHSRLIERDKTYVVRFCQPLYTIRKMHDFDSRIKHVMIGFGSL